jgi:tetratricopeptide (TPR) repeat protein
MPDQSFTAEAVLNQAITAYPTARELVTWQRMLAGTLSERGQWREAERIYNDILLDFPNDYLTWINLAWLQYEHLGDVENAISKINQAISISPNNGFSYFTMGRLMAAENHYDEADQWFQQAVDRNPFQSNWWHTRVETVISSGKNQDALEINQIALKNVPGDMRLYLQQARIYQRLDDRNSALSSVRKAVSNGKLSTWQWLEAGLIYKWAGEDQNAIECFQQALILNPDNEQALYHMDKIKASGNE